MAVSLAGLLPEDWRSGSFLGRIDLSDGPVPVLIAGGALYDLSPSTATVSGAIERGQTTPQHGHRIADLDANDPRLPEGATLLAPIDLQCIKAAGVTFAVSAIERVIEERARGDASQAAAIRGRLEERVGSGIRSVVPGSAEAAELKRVLIEDGMWSQYLEVAIGPDAEVFTKSPVLSAVGHDAPIGVRSDSSWNNPEPEIVLAVSSRGETVGAMLGNDVNLRDFEGRSALLLGKAKDNTASCALGPFIRLFDEGFTIDDVRSADVALTIEGTDGFRLEGASRMSEISRDPLDIVAQAMSEHHYPDGFVLFLGTLFAPTQDRDVAGGGFTHKIDDRVTIASPRLGTLTNTVTTSKNAPIWEIGIGVFVRDLARRGLADRI
ncbi:fumarylacetoacetate hydrolase family protein [Sphingomonas sp. ST-64]|uniref:Fumarylacetoacetate hydrolase family protein n=1 Tax=Sphingomonas plantiphila TaxID=3163295 RepID=A0ABW8YKR5_9SPHN